MRIRILLAEDHTFVREGLRMILERHPQFEIVGEAECGRDVVRLSERLEPDIVIMDIAMRDMNGIEATARIKRHSSRTKVIALTMHSDRHHVLEMLTAGASGYILKTAGAEELTRAVIAVAKGRDYLTPEIAGIVVESYVRGQLPTAASVIDSLGRREREVLRLVAEGRSSKEIAALLGISAATVDTHRRNIMRKLGSHSVAELTKIAIREGLTELES